MSLEDLPILRAGTTISFKDFRDKIAEVVYQEEIDAIHVVGYVLGVLPPNNYVLSDGKIVYGGCLGCKRRLLLVREVIPSRSEDECIWGNIQMYQKEVEIPLKNILKYRELEHKEK